MLLISIITSNSSFHVLDVLHMTCRQQKTAREDLAVAVSKLLHLEPSDGSARVDTDSQATQTLKQVCVL